VSPEIARLPPDCAIAELPADFWTGAVALFRSTAHWRPLVNGYSGFYGIEPWTSYWFLNQFPNPVALEYLYAWGTCAVVVRSAQVMPDVATASAALGFETHRAGDEFLVRLPPAPPPAPLGPRFPRAGWFATGPAGSASAVLDGDVETLWTASTTTAPAPEQL